MTSTVIAVRGVDGVYRVLLADEDRDTIVHYYAVKRPAWSQTERRMVNETIERFICRTCPPLGAGAPDCPHIISVRRFQA